MILTRSPYILTIPWDSPSSGTTPDKYILQLFIWNGQKTSVPANPTYEIENKNPLARSGNSFVNISNEVDSEISIVLPDVSSTGIVKSFGARWVKSQVIYYIGGVAQSPEFVNIDLAFKGYGYGIEGANYQLTNFSGVNFANISNNSTYLLPMLFSEVDDIDIQIISQPNNNINQTTTITSSNNSEDLIRYAVVKCSDIGNDTSIQIKKDDVVIHTLILKEELRYEPLDIAFINKAGQLQTTTFFKDKTVSLNVESESYESSNGQPINGVHQFVNFNTNGKTEFKINSGWVKESYNEIFKQLMLSDKAWELKNNVFIPVNLKKKSIQYQTRQRDRLLNYEFEFEYAFSEVNNI
jgi:hypothetical protein